MGIAEEQIMKQLVKQQIKLLKKKRALRVLKHVSGRAAILEFAYSENFFGQVCVKGDVYRQFEAEGGFKDLTEDEMLEEEDEEMKAPVSETQGVSDCRNPEDFAKPEVKKEVKENAEIKQVTESKEPVK